jgi:Heterokaryon incompatibility protein (HET)
MKKICNLLRCKLAYDVDMLLCSVCLAKGSMPTPHYFGLSFTRIWVGHGKQLRDCGLMKKGCVTPWPAFGPAEDIPPTLELDTCAKFARKWIDNCEKNHAESCLRKQSKLPKRVLDLGADGLPSTLKLKETKEETGCYTTLSHRWGDPSLGLSTTKANISNFLLEIPWSQLPKTFQDAVAITRKLGVRYLWIDSLCIIQDDRHDWDLESAKMAAIYSSSFLTIAATNAADAQKGCFSTRWTVGHGLLDLPRMSPEAIEITVDLSKEGQEGQVLVRPGYHLSHEDNNSLHLVSKMISPLLTRAWVLQELLLSTRILHLHAEEMVWECKGCSACECTFLDPPNSPNESIDSVAHTMHNDDGQLYPERATSYQSLLEPYIHSEFAQLCGGDRNPGVKKTTTWFTVISQYAKLGLTEETDRLIALSGLASAVSKHRSPDDSYLAGMWKEDLGHGLFWRVPWAHKQPVTRAPQPCPPTWSWASVHLVMGVRPLPWPAVIQLL